jgi:hypothetical protein
LALLCQAHKRGRKKVAHLFNQAKILGGNSLNCYHCVKHHFNLFYMLLSIELSRNRLLSLCYLCHKDCRIAYLEVVLLQSGSNLESFRQEFSLGEKDVPLFSTPLAALPPLEECLVCTPHCQLRLQAQTFQTPDQSRS